DTADDATNYDAMDHSIVNRRFAADFLAIYSTPTLPVLDVGTGTAQIPIELCRQEPALQIIAVDLAESMLSLGHRNIADAQLTDRIQLQLVNARTLGFLDGHFSGVISNSIIHHIPEPRDAFTEMLRVLAPGGCLFVRDLCRPDSIAELNHIVNQYATNDSPRQRQLFADSLHAALTLAEVRILVGTFGLSPEIVQMTSDRHWTLAYHRGRP
ncbi:MAG: class I SAM-dependent methyltransferase, partial [Gemmataceae bacterium]